MERYKRNPNTACVVCHKRIYKRPSEIEKNHSRVFCSIACYSISNRKEKPCVVCGTLIQAHFNKKTCSRRCSNIHRTGIKYKLSGPRKDKVETYKALKLRLLAQRGRQCERCGYTKFEILQVHHKDRNHSNNELSNLELICPNCHYEEHFLQHSWLKELFKEEV